MTNKKREILNVVLDYLSQQDEQKKFTIANVAQSLDMGKSTIYEYFSHKEQMIEEAVTMLIEENLSYMLSIEGFDSLNFKHAFYAHIKRGFEITEKHQMAHEFAQHVEFASIGKDVKMRIMGKVLEFYSKSRAQMHQIYQKGIEEGILASTISDARLRTIEALTFGVFVSSSNPINNWTCDMMIDDLYQSVVLLHR